MSTREGYRLALFALTCGLAMTVGIVPFSHGMGSIRNAAPADDGPFAPTIGPWPTYMSNVERTSANLLEKTVGPSNVARLIPIWTRSDNGSDFSAPVVAGGTVYYGSWGGDELAVSAAAGAVEWSRFLGTDTACGGYTPMGISSTPAYSGGSLYLGGGDGYWYALNAATGATEWRYFAGSETDGYYNWASALVSGNSLYIGLSSCFDSPLVPAGVLELNLTGAHTVSHFINTTPPGQTGESIWTTPALDPQNGTLWISTGNENPPGYPIYANAIVGLNATTLNVSGSWQVPNVAGQDSDFGSTPTLFATSSGIPMVVATDKNGVAYALNRSNVSRSGTWAPAWNLTTGGGFSGGAFDGRTLYLAGGSSIYAVDPDNGSVLWTAGMVGGGTITGSLAWANGVVFAEGGGEIEAVDATNGTVLWNYSFPAGQSGVTEPVIADGRLYVASGNYGDQGYLIAFGLPTAPGPAGPLWLLIAGIAVVVAAGAVLVGFSRRGRRRTESLARPPASRSAAERQVHN